MARDERTDRQKAADAAIDVAVREAAAAYGEDVDGEPKHLVTEWLVISTAIPSDPDDVDDDRTFMFAPENGRHTHRSHLLGMLWSGQLALLEGDDLT